MPNNFSVYLILWGLLQLLVEVNCQMTPFKPTIASSVCLNGIMYLWGGMSGDLFSNDMLILDTINLNWKEGSLIKAPTPRCQYGATLLPNNNIIYLGGNDENLTFDPKTLAIDNMGTALTLSEVYIYDTIHDNWTTKKAVGKIPPNRAGFSTVLGLDGLTVIIFGGYFNDPGYLDPALYVLDLTHFTWYVPKVSGIIPSPRVWHKANVIGKYMVISF
ncbi:hypothetical protein C1645_818133, partial [Glomus cerebriforme]